MLVDFPSCFGCVNGIYIRLECPDGPGSVFYNYKQYFSLLFQGFADAKCKFFTIDAGGSGKQIDGVVFRESKLYRCLTEKLCNCPSSKLPNSSQNLS